MVLLCCVSSAGRGGEAVGLVQVLYCSLECREWSLGWRRMGHVGYSEIEKDSREKFLNNHDHVFLFCHVNIYVNVIVTCQDLYKGL